ncbi:MAG: PH domain-containing protein [Bacteroidetes bacterium]|nr:PH domain-containing protein [Bacteroidota bacterium]
MIQTLHTTGDFDKIINRDEKIIWSARPKLAPYLFAETGFMFLGIAFGIAWIIIALNLPHEDNMTAKYFWIFGAVYLAQMSFVTVRKLVYFKHTVYALSNQRILIRTGFMGRDFKTTDLEKIADIEVKVNMVSKFYKVGSIRFFSGVIKKDDSGSSKVYESWLGIEEPYEVFKLVKQTTRELQGKL